MTKDEITIRDLRQKIDELEESIRQLKAACVGQVQPEFPFEWKLTKQQRKCLTVLFNAYPNYITRESLTNRILKKDEEAAYNFASVIIFKIKGKIPKSIVIETIWGVGYRLSEHGHGQLSLLPKVKIL